MRVLHLLAAGTCALLALASCTVVDSLGGLTGGGTDASSSDAVAVEAAAVEASSPDDSSSPPDATVDAPPDVTLNTFDSGAPPLDSSAHDAGSQADAPVEVGPLFADDFEGMQALPRNWDFLFSDGGAIGLDTSVSVSPITSLSTASGALDAAAPGNAVNVTLRKRFPMPPPGGTAVFDFHTNPLQYDTHGADAVLGALQIADTAGDLYELQLDTVAGDGGTMTVTFAEYTGLADGGSSYLAHVTTGALKGGGWNEVRMELTLSQPPIARVYLGGALAVETTVTVGITGSAVQISLGLSYVRPSSSAWLVDYDDPFYEVTQSP